MAQQHVIAHVTDLKDGQMKKVQVDGHEVLLLRLGDTFRAFGATCPHRGAPLYEGLLHERRIRCPWHHSVFAAESGDILQPPTLDAIPRFNVSVDGNDVVLSLGDEVPTAVTPHMSVRDDKADGRTYVILGTGAAAIVAAETLRQCGFKGRLVMITRESEPPYDRTELSKRYLRKSDAPQPFVRDRAFYSRYGIELLTETTVVEVDPRSRQVTFADGHTLHYDRMLLASGADPRTLDVPGMELPGVQLLRTYETCEEIRTLADMHKRVAVIGSSFIGMEVAASLRERGLEVTVISPEQAPFSRSFGSEIGRMYQHIHEDKGVHFELGTTVDRFEGDDKVKAVVLKNGRRIEVDFAVVGVGVRPVSDYLKGVPINDDGSVNVDATMAITEDLYAAGDMATWPDWRTGEPIRIEHWRLAQQLGKIAAMAMAGRRTRYHGVPFFWTNQYMIITQYVGFAHQWDQIVIDGSIDDQHFVAYYLKDGKVLAAAGLNQERQICLVAELLSAGAPSVDQIRAQIAQMEHLMEV